MVEPKAVNSETLTKTELDPNQRKVLVPRKGEWAPNTSLDFRIATDL